MGDVELNLSLTDCKRCISQKHYAKLSRAMRAPWVDRFLNNEIYCYPLSGPLENYVGAPTYFVGAPTYYLGAPSYYVGAPR